MFRPGFVVYVCCLTLGFAPESQHSQRLKDLRRPLHSCGVGRNTKRNTGRKFGRAKNGRPGKDPDL